MTNPTESDYDKQFQEDLEKATALSMETLAMDQFKRNKLQYSHSDVSSSSSTGMFYKSQCKCFLGFNTVCWADNFYDINISMENQVLKSD